MATTHGNAEDDISRRLRLTEMEYYESNPNAPDPRRRPEHLRGRATPLLPLCPQQRPTKAAEQAPRPPRPVPHRHRTRSTLLLQSEWLAQTMLEFHGIPARFAFDRPLCGSFTKCRRVRMCWFYRQGRHCGTHQLGSGHKNVDGPVQQDAKFAAKGPAT